MCILGWEEACAYYGDDPCVLHRILNFDFATSSKKAGVPYFDFVVQEVPTTIFTCWYTATEIIPIVTIQLATLCHPLSLNQLQNQSKSIGTSSQLSTPPSVHQQCTRVYQPPYPVRDRDRVDQLLDVAAAKAKMCPRPKPCVTQHQAHPKTRWRQGLNGVFLMQVSSLLGLFQMEMLLYRA